MYKHVAGIDFGRGKRWVQRYAEVRNGFYGGRDFQPRVGFAWTPKRLGGYTVVRGAFTISSYLEGMSGKLRTPLPGPAVGTPSNSAANTSIKSSRPSTQVTMVRCSVTRHVSWP